jgi:2-hydroxychromene-2-carboxylate isomerase
MTGTPIDFYFEYSSPYGYIASERIEALAAKHGRSVVWKPFLLGIAFKTEGTQSLISYPKKGAYSKHDIERSARFHGLPFRWPPQFPVYTVHAARATLWAQQAVPDRAVDLIHALYRRIFADGAEIGQKGDVLSVIEAAGLNREAAQAAMQSAAIKTALRAETQAAIDAGVFGSPYMVADGEPFWGADRLEMLDAWLARGGW